MQTRNNAIPEGLLPIFKVFSVVLILIYDLHKVD